MKLNSDSCVRSSKNSQSQGGQTQGGQSQGGQTQGGQSQGGQTQGGQSQGGQSQGGKTQGGQTQGGQDQVQPQIIDSEYHFLAHFGMLNKTTRQSIGHTFDKLIVTCTFRERECLEHR